MAVLNPISRFERCNKAIRQLAQGDMEQGAGEMSGGFVGRVTQDDPALKRVIIQSHAWNIHVIA